jgi:hypothetical protein
MVILKRPIEVMQKAIQQAEHVADAPGKKDSTVSVRRDLGLTGVLKSCRILATSGKLWTSLSRSKRIYPPIC